MNLSQINPVLTETMGWDAESAQNEELVTFVKRAVVYSEVTLPKSEYLKMLNSEEPALHFEEEIEPKMITDDVMEDFGKELDKYAIFEGDISSMTDDVIAMCDFEWEHYMSCNSKVHKVNFALF